MIPHMTRGGRSFKGAFMYYMHDKNAQTRDRISWTHTENMITRDPDKAWKVMAYTAMVQDRLKEASGIPPTGRKLEKPVMAFSLSWHPSLKPDKDHMLETALESVDKLGLREHEILVVAHSDTKHPHVHVMVNRIHPVTGLVASDSFTHRRLSDFALAYEKKHGLELCPQRKENKTKRKKGEMTRYRDPSIQAAWDQSIDGPELKQELGKRGYILAQGRKRIVVVDNRGKEINPVRHIKDIKTRDLVRRLGILAINLPTPDSIKSHRKNLDKAPVVGNEFESSSMPQSQLSSKDESFTLSKSLIEKQARDRENLAIRHKTQLTQEKRRIAQGYQLPQKLTAIKALQDKCKAPPWWKRWTGIARSERKQLRSAISEYKDCKQLYDERIRAIRGRQQSEEEHLTQYHAQQVERMMSLNQTPQRSQVHSLSSQMPLAP